MCVCVWGGGYSSWEAGLAPATQLLVPTPHPQVDHAAAVKEYSRSSADQEEPLPHELRPSAVLSRTMDYLVTQIMDQTEGSLRDWYDFLWNRTRGIRKVSATSDEEARKTRKHTWRLEWKWEFLSFYISSNKKNTVP